MTHRLHGLNRNSYEIIFMFLLKKPQPNVEELSLNGETFRS